jgi:two-component system, NarL family, sensor histidine kinase DesK
VERWQVRQRSLAIDYPPLAGPTSVRVVTEPQPGPPAAPKQDRLRRPRLVIGLWLLYLIPAVWAIYVSDRPVPVRVLGYALVVSFAALFARVFLTAWRERFGGEPLGRTARIAAFVALTVQAAVIVWIAGQTAMVTWLYLVQASVLLLAGWTMWIITTVTLLAGVLLIELTPDWHSSVWLAVAAPAAALVLWGFMRILDQNRTLENTTAEMAQLAVERERLRMARDLHDILGHSLTTVTVKAELARKMIGRDDERVAQELTDVERLSREALRDIRATVSGQRTTTLAMELAVARSVLASAGISADLPSSAESVPERWRSLFGWVIREGVTNVVRHSGATRCWIAVGPSAVEIADDGTTHPPPGEHSRGLHGLRERAEAEGASMSAGPRGDGTGWLLRVQVPA